MKTKYKSILGSAFVLLSALSTLASPAEQSQSPSAKAKDVPKASAVAVQASSQYVTIRFNGNGGSVRESSVRVHPGNLWGEMQTPTRSGYMFVGWYTTSSGGSLITASTAVPSYSTTYYAHWERILSLAASLDGSGLNWTSDSWHGQALDTLDGVDACRSGAVGHNQSTYLQTSVSGSGTLSFWWKVSSESSYDALRFLVDGVQQQMISGEVGWQYVSIRISGTGSHTLKWNYTKDSTVTKGQDCGWLDQVYWTPDPVYLVPIYFDGNGGYVREPCQWVRPGNLWGKMQTPTSYWPSEYMFVGWYTAPVGGTLITASTAVPSYSTTYYAHWERILSLAASLDGSGLNWTSDSWHGQALDTHDGVDACRCGSMCNNQSTYLQTTVSGPGTISFWWKVSCEPTGYDALRFLVDGVQQRMISGEIGWQYVSISVSGSGTHTLKFNYTKDGSITKGQDCGWVDQVYWTPAAIKTVYFYANGGSCSYSSYSYAVGNTYGWLPTPTRSGYTFDGWYTSTSGGTHIYTSSTVSSSVTYLYAHWTPTQSLGDAIDYTTYSTASGGSASWFVESSSSYVNGSAARSGSIGANQSTYLQTTVYNAGQLMFRWKVSSESCCDKLRLYVDGILRREIGGTSAGWISVLEPISGSGLHTVKWEYSKDGSVNSGSDCGWVDGVSYYQDAAGEGWYSDASNRGVLRSVATGHSGRDTLTWTISGAGVLSFDWKVSSESCCDRLHFYIDGVEQTSIGGEVDWTSLSYSLGSGTHEFVWEYLKDGSVSSGSDCGWLRSINFTR